MEGDNGHTKTEKALNFTLETFREGARDPLKLVPKVAVLVTDGNADNGQGEDQARPGALAAAERVKKDGEITLIVVGLKGQQGIDEKELSKMGKPERVRHLCEGGAAEIGLKNQNYI
ncbi:hypothetical protein AAVH_13584 [Aphelenchoides avenae]|nr:hypothetical protein AAVH_13584 [Aphelenchus avenae]